MNTPTHHIVSTSQSHEYETISIKKYQKLKSELKKMEAKNHNHIYIIPCNGSKGWLEFAEHSALFFYYGPCQKFHLNYKFMDDVTSFYNQYEIGYMHTLSISAIVNHLKRAGLFQNLEKRDYFTIITLNKTYSSQEIEDLKSTENARRLENLIIKNAVNLDPKLYQILINLSVRLHKICNHQLDKLWDLTLCISIAEPVDAARIHIERDIKRLSNKSSHPVQDPKDITTDHD